MFAPSPGLITALTFFKSSYQRGRLMTKIIRRIFIEIGTGKLHFRWGMFQLVYSGFLMERLGNVRM